MIFRSTVKIRFRKIERDIEREGDKERVRERKNIVTARERERERNIFRRDIAID